MACVNDKWDEKEPEKGHKLVDYAGRCINVPTDPAAEKSAGDCVGSYEYMPDESWKGSGTCTYTVKGGDKFSDSWEEGSHLKEYTYKFTGGTGKYQGASGGGTYFYENITDTLAGRHIQGHAATALSVWGAASDAGLATRPRPRHPARGPISS